MLFKKWDQYKLTVSIYVIVVFLYLSMSSSCRFTLSVPYLFSHISWALLSRWPNSVCLSDLIQHFYKEQIMKTFFQFLTLSTTLGALIIHVDGIFTLGCTIPLTLPVTTVCAFIVTCCFRGSYNWISIFN